MDDFAQFLSIVTQLEKIVSICEMARISVKVWYVPKKLAIRRDIKNPYFAPH